MFCDREKIGVEWKGAPEVKDNLVRGLSFLLFRGVLGREEATRARLRLTKRVRVLYVWGTSVVLSFCHRDCTDLSQTLIILFLLFPLLFDMIQRQGWRFKLENIPFRSQRFL